MGLLGDVSIGEAGFLAIAVPKDDMDALTMPKHMPVEHLRERRRVGRRRLGRLFGNNMPGSRIQGGQPPRACERRQQILKRLSLAEQLFGQPHGEGAFDPK